MHRYKQLAIIWLISMCVALGGLMYVALAADIPTLTGPVIANPGNGEYRLITNSSAGFTTVSVVQMDPHIIIPGTITFYSGAYSAVLDLTSERTLILAGPVPALRIVLEGIDSASEFNIVLR